ncbi:hypothetical protein WJX74_007812 [Apatococcus lobatus]|uniref:Uncharacterized protein n=1 Tax=Apatococcus lobatus TaxID=904363 RepID=A0AAW1RHS3_9CHLO
MLLPLLLVFFSTADGTRSSCNAWLSKSLRHSCTLPEGFHRHHFYISLSTIPARLPFLQPVLRNLVRQTQAADAIFLALPVFSSRESRCYRIPHYLKADPELRPIRVLRSDIDYGPATKVIPLLQLIQSSGLPLLQNVRILVLDDDQLYPLNMVETYKRWSNERADSALTMRGHKLPAGKQHNWQHISAHSIIHSYELASLTCVDIVTAVGSYLVQPRFFTPALWEGLQPTPSSSGSSASTRAAAHNADDVWISGMLARRGVAREAIPGRLEQYTTVSLPSDYASKMTIKPWIDAALLVPAGSPTLHGGPFAANMHLLAEFAADWSCPGSMHTLPNCLLGSLKQDLPLMLGVPCMKLDGQILH